MNTNPVTDEIKLLPGIYVIGALIKSNIETAKRFSIRLAVQANSQIVKHEFTWKHVANTIYLDCDSTESIKLVMSKCGVCECVLDDVFVTSGSSVYCKLCYDAAFRCALCDSILGQSYFTVEKQILCEKCSEKYL